MSHPVGVPSISPRSRYQRRSERLARMVCGLPAHPGNASSVIPRPSSNPLANASSSSVPVAGATEGPAKMPNAASAYAIRRPFVVPARMDRASSVAQPGLACCSPSVLPTQDGRSFACEGVPLDPGTQALWEPAATAAKAAIAAVAACAPSMQAHTAAVATATAVFIVVAHQQDSLSHQQLCPRGVTRPRSAGSSCGCGHTGCDDCCPRGALFQINGHIGCDDCSPSGSLFENRRKVTRRA